MVHRRVTGRLAVALAAAAAIVAATAPAAAADNRRISISDYRWSNPAIQLDLGEHVTWYWTGPDLMHSVTGEPPAAAGLDSDPTTSFPAHDLGDSFQLAFNQPGVYDFQCKLHSTVRGTVTVSSTPGDPASEPDPVPRSNVDQTPPRLRDVRLGAKVFGARGTSLRFSLGERSRVAAELYRYDDDGRRRFAGYRTWKAYIGYNGVRLGRRSAHFRPLPGRYLVKITATDASTNASTPRRLHFRIRGR